MNSAAHFVTTPLFFKSVLLGFCAQMLGSSLGMAYSVTCSSVLLSLGISPVMVSASVHTSEVVNRLFSGLSHFRFGNIDIPIFKKLALYGAAGALCGAFVLTSVPVGILRPVMAAILLLMGVRILRMAFFTDHLAQKPTRLEPLGFAGGVIDVVGGGGWGPVVTTTLMLRGNDAHIVIGSINFAKFFVAVVESAALLILLKSPEWTIIAGLIAGGLCAAPLGVWGCRRLPKKILLLLVGLLVCGLSIRSILKALL